MHLRAALRALVRILCVVLRLAVDAKVKQALPVTDVDFQDMQELLLSTYTEYQQLMTDL